MPTPAQPRQLKLNQQWPTWLRLVAICRLSAMLAVRTSAPCGTGLGGRAGVDAATEGKRREGGAAGLHVP